MRNFGPRPSSNPGFQRRPGQNQPSGLVAVLILGAGVYYYLGASGKFQSLLDSYLPKQVVEQSVETKQTAESAAVDVALEPTSVKILKNSHAYSSFNGGRIVCDVEKGAEFSILDIEKDLNGKPSWVQVRSNGMAVWVKSSEVEILF